MLCQTLCGQCYIYISITTINTNESNIGFTMSYILSIHKNTSSVSMYLKSQYLLWPNKNISPCCLYISPYHTFPDISTSFTLRLTVQASLPEAPSPVTQDHALFITVTQLPWWLMMSQLGEGPHFHNKVVKTLASSYWLDNLLQKLIKGEIFISRFLSRANG